MQGTVKFFNSKKGWGFAKGEDDRDYFIHFKNIAGEGFKTLLDGDSITFDPASDPKSRGPLAANIKRVSV